MTFEEWLMEKKNDGLTNEEIAKELNVSITTLKKMRGMYGIEEEKKMKNVRINNYGFTQEQLRIADENGIGRRIALRRFREHHWTREDAITIPKGMRRESYGKTKHQLQLERSDYHKEYNQMKKAKIWREIKKELGK